MSKVRRAGLSQNILKMTDEEQEAMQLLSQNVWNAFYTQGGSISPNSDAAHESDTVGIYSIAGIVIDCGQKVRIGATAIDVAHNDEVFRIAVWNDLKFGRPEYEIRFRPARQLLTQYPSDLNLSAFIGTSNSVELVEGVYRMAETDLSYDRGLFIRNSSGSELLIIADEFFPLNIRITTSVVLGSD